jgi:hypothetical protein
MADIMNMRRDGQFIVELIHPLKRIDGDVTELVIHPLNFQQVIRWQSGEIESRLALVAEATRLPERLLRLLVYPDVNRVMFAFTYTLPVELRENFSNGERPLTTADEKLAEIPEEQVGDQDDPRFPHVDGPVRKFPTPPQVNLPQKSTRADDGSGFDISAPDAMKAVHG